MCQKNLYKKKIPTPRPKPKSALLLQIILPDSITWKTICNCNRINHHKSSSEMASSSFLAFSYFLSACSSFSVLKTALVDNKFTFSVMKQK